MRIHRNYASDRPLMYKEIYTAICKGFDELQKDLNGVDINEMMKFVMRETKGHCNPALVLKLLEEFER